MLHVILFVHNLSLSLFLSFSLFIFLSLSHSRARFLSHPFFHPFSPSHLERSQRRKITTEAEAGASTSARAGLGPFVHSLTEPWRLCIRRNSWARWLQLLRDTSLFVDEKKKEKKHIAFDSKPNIHREVCDDTRPAVGITSLPSASYKIVAFPA